MKAELRSPRASTRRQGNEPIQCRIGTAGSTRCSRCTAESAKPRRLQDSATKCEWPQLRQTSGALGGEAFYKVFSQELFSTLLRATAQGITFGLARVVLGVWSFFVPVLASAGIEGVAGLLTLSLVISGGVGFFFMPDTTGKSLEQLEAERSKK